MQKHRPQSLLGLINHIADAKWLRLHPLFQVFCIFSVYILNIHTKDTVNRLRVLLCSFDWRNPWDTQLAQQHFAHHKICMCFIYTNLQQIRPFKEKLSKKENPLLKTQPPTDGSDYRGRYWDFVWVFKSTQTAKQREKCSELDLRMAQLHYDPAVWMVSSEKWKLTLQR